MGRAIQLLASGAILAALAGCSLCPHCRRGGSCCPGGGDEAPLPTVERTVQERAIQDLAAAVQSPASPDDPKTPSDYRALAPQLCQCLAAKHAPLADGFDNQRRQLEQQEADNRCLCGRKSDKQRAFQESMLLYSALESRNDAAGKALEWYYQLAGSEAKADLLNISLELGRNMLERADKMKKQGFRLPTPIEEYQRQVVELQLQQAQNQLTIEQLNGKLRLALGYDSHSWRIWPDPSIELGLENPPEVEAAIRFGLQHRPQLLLLRGMIANLDRDTLGSSRGFLQVVSPLLAMSNPETRCKWQKILDKILHIEPGKEAEVERVRAQLRDYLRERERSVAAEIYEAVYEIGARRKGTVLARQAADSWQERIRDLTKQRAEGLRGVIELSNLYMEWYKARGVVVQEFLGWRIAVVKLKTAQGTLPDDCGYSDCKCHAN
jgi:hypothetical protein